MKKSLLLLASLSLTANALYADGNTNPFGKDVTVNEGSYVEDTNTIEILDINTAEACDISEISEGYPLDGIISAVGNDWLRLRSWPWGNVINSYPGGTSVKVLGKSGEFYLVDINGAQGYMHQNYISTSESEASGVDPIYPSNTKSGGALSMEEGIEASKNPKENKVSNNTTTAYTGNSSSSGNSAGAQAFVKAAEDYAQYVIDNGIQYGANVFSCSMFVSRALQNAGITTGSFWATDFVNGDRGCLGDTSKFEVIPFSEDALQEGDILISSYSASAGTAHSGIYYKGGTMEGYPGNPPILYTQPSRPLYCSNPGSVWQYIVRVK